MGIDKSQWPVGPWTTEPDEVQWVSCGIHCLVRRNPIWGNLCGYVGVEDDHPWFDRDLGNFRHIGIHGGITAVTFGNPEEWKQYCDPGQVYWVGFDCGHGFDGCPRIGNGFNYRTVGYVTAEVDHLVRYAVEARNQTKGD